MSSVIPTDIIQTVLETLEYFLSNTNNKETETETEELAVYFWHLIHPSYSILPPSPKEVLTWLSKTLERQVRIDIGL